MTHRLLQLKLFIISVCLIILQISSARSKDLLELKSAAMDLKWCTVMLSTAMVDIFTPNMSQMLDLDLFTALCFPPLPLLGLNPKGN